MTKVPQPTPGPLLAPSLLPTPKKNFYLTVTFFPELFLRYAGDFESLGFNTETPDRK